MIKIQNLICRIIFFAIYCLANLENTNAQQIDVDAFETKLESTKEAQLIDVRTASEFAGGHLKNAKNINVRETDFVQKIATLNKSKPIFVYCLSGGRSKIAADQFRAAGFTDVNDMAGGYLKWSSAKKQVEGVVENKDAKNVNSKELKDFIKSHKLVLLDFYAEWCGPCKQMDPFLQKIKKEFEGKGEMVKIDTDANKKLAQEYEVNALPTFIFYVNGKQVWKADGLQDEEFIRELFELNVEK